MQVANDKVVSFHYRLTLDNGSEIDSSYQAGEPLKFLVGQGQIIPGLENAMIGMSIGESKEVIVEPAQAYGLHKKELVKTVPRDQLPSDIELQVGLVLTGQDEKEQEYELIVRSFTDADVTLDMNHPLAGKRLNFAVEVVEVRDATGEEIKHGHAH
ncbi:peptidylprolyl isomerase [candidate division KSB1 bacterium]|nr:peptidylprolyl isomerase [candidate division KSB1 bacterium]